MFRRLNEQDIPHHNLSEGGSLVQINVADYDGKLRIGQNPRFFEMVWEGLGENRVRAYNSGDNIVGVAVIRNQPIWRNPTTAALERLNYSSRYRNISAGEMAVFKNVDGNYLIAHVVELRYQGEDDGFLSLECIVHDAGLGSGQPNSSSPKPGPLTRKADMDTTLPALSARKVAEESETDLEPTSRQYETVSRANDVYDLYGQVTVAAALAERHLSEAFEEFDRNADGGEYGGLGHNHPPPDILVDQQSRIDALNALRSLQGLNGPLGEAALARVAEAGRLLARSAHALWDWIEPRVGKFADSFAETLGKSAASKTWLLSAMMVATGQVTKVVELVERMVTTLSL